MRNLPRTLTILPLLSLFLAGCSGGTQDAGVATLAASTDIATSDGDVTATEVDSEQAMLDFAACMRDEGIDFADPVVGDDGELRFGPPGGADGDAPSEDDREAQRTARETCSSHLEGLDLAAGGGRGDREFDSEAFLVFAECMRENGIDEFPDPSADGRPDRDAMQAIDATSDAFQTAAATCSEEAGIEAPGGGGQGQRGPGGPDA